MVKLSNDEKRRLVKLMADYIPHTALLGITVESVVGEELTCRLPYNPVLVGNAETGTLHGGALTVLLDQTLGMSSVCCDLVKPAVTPTLDLRIDHLGMAPPKKDIFAAAHVYRATRKVLFIEGIAYCDNKERPIAKAIGSWVIVGDVDISWLYKERQGLSQ